MQQYESPQVRILYILPGQAVASDTATRETTKDENFEVGSVPEVNEGVEDW